MIIAANSQKRVWKKAYLTSIFLGGALLAGTAAFGCYQHYYPKYTTDQEGYVVPNKKRRIFPYKVQCSGFPAGLELVGFKVPTKGQVTFIGKLQDEKYTQVTRPDGLVELSGQVFYEIRPDSRLTAKDGDGSPEFMDLNHRLGDIREAKLLFRKNQ